MTKRECVSCTDHAVLQVFEADVDEYRARYGKAEGERLFRLEHQPTATKASVDPPEPSYPPIDPLASFSIHAGLGRSVIPPKGTPPNACSHSH